MLTVFLEGGSFETVIVLKKLNISFDGLELWKRYKSLEPYPDYLLMFHIAYSLAEM